MPLYLKRTRAQAWGKQKKANFHRRACVLERIYASRNAINMQIIKQKSDVSATASK